MNDGVEVLQGSNPPIRRPIQVDLKNATQNICSCGCEYFLPVIKSYTLPALASPTGQELMAQKTVLICIECKKILE